MSPDDYIREFFATIKTYLGEAEIKSSGRHAKYKNSSITASWTDELWNVEMHDDVLGPMKRLYDPSIARSAETAAVSFIDALRKAAGEEPLEPDLHVMMNMADDPHDFAVPVDGDRSWQLFANTARSSPDDIFEAGSEPPFDGDRCTVEGRSIVILISPDG